MGGEEELEAVRQAAAAIQQSCDGLADFLVTVDQRHQQQQQQAQQGADGDAGAGGEAGALAASGRLGDSLTAAVRELEAMDWLVPPMLQAR